MIPFDVLSSAILVTVLLVAAGFSIGVVLGLPVALCRLSSQRILRIPARMLIDVIRGVPPLVWIFLIYFGLGSKLVQMDALPASIGALGLISTGYLAEIYRGGLLSVAKGQYEASSALGIGKIRTFVSVILPQGIRVSIPSATTFAIGLLKDSSLASAIGVADVVFRATAVARSGSDAITPFVLAGLIYIAISVPLALFSRRLDRTLRQKVSA